jgi:predicted Fe-S protein YdhL (DUF1289 family)
MTTPAVRSPRPRHSPCIGVCKLDEATGLCLGCARTGSEIASWASLDEPGRDAVWQQLPERVAALALRVRLLPWTGSEIADWAARSIGDRLGTWVTGVPGATAEFPCRPDRSVSVETVADEVVGRADDALFRLRASDRLRAFAFERGGPIVIGAARARAMEAPFASFTPLGADASAIDPRHGHELLFDLGLGRRFSRFCIRTCRADLVARLNALAGSSWADVLDKAGAAILSDSPARVVESQLARIEVFAPLRPPGGQSPAGARTSLLPQFLASGEEIPGSLALPAYAAPVAIFYPDAPHRW